MKKLYFCPFVVISLMLASGTLKWKCPLKAFTAQGFDSATANLG